jgi:effector-binding domain-containing protein
LVHNNIPVNHIRQLLQVKKTEIQERLDQDKRKLRQVDEWLDKINKDGIIPIVSGIQIKVVPALKVISKREIGTYGGTLLKLDEELMSVLNRRENQAGIVITGPVIMLSYDDEYKEKDADIEIAIPISGDITTDDPSIMIKILPEVRVISAIHKGPYSGIGKVYSQIFTYADENDLKLVTPDREIYLNKRNEISEEELLTEIQFPFKDVVSE